MTDLGEIAYVAFWTTVSHTAKQEERANWQKQHAGLQDAWRAVAKAVLEMGGKDGQ